MDVQIQAFYRSEHVACRGTRHNYYQRAALDVTRTGDGPRLCRLHDLKGTPAKLIAKQRLKLDFWGWILSWTELNVREHNYGRPQPLNHGRSQLDIPASETNLFRRPCHENSRLRLVPAVYPNFARQAVPRLLRSLASARGLTYWEARQ